MANTTRRSRVPNIDVSDAHYQFLDSVDKRQQRLGELPNLSGGASTADIVAKINAILESHRTR